MSNKLFGREMSDGAKPCARSSDELRTSTTFGDRWTKLSMFFMR
jgi:hypothetical protein